MTRPVKAASYSKLDEELIDELKSFKHTSLNNANFDSTIGLITETIEDLEKCCYLNTAFVRVIENTKEAWSQHSNAYSLLESFDNGPSQPHQKLTLVTETFVSSEQKSQLFDVLNLSHFFFNIAQSCYRFSNDNVLLSFVFIIKCDKASVAYRIESALSFLALAYKESVSILIKCSENKCLYGLAYKNVPAVKSRKLPPILPIGAHNASVAHIKVETISYFELESETNALSEDDLSAIANGSFDEHAIINSTRNNNQMLYLFKMNTVSTLMHIRDNVSGTTNRHLDEKEKENIQERVLEKMIEHLSSANLLCQAIYVECVYFALQQKQLLRLGDTQAPLEELRMLDKIAFDALSYAEGAMQAIENSCFNTALEIAHFAMSVHDLYSDTSKRVTESALDALETRYRLERRISPKRKHRISLTQGYYLEMRIIDLSEQEYWVTDKQLTIGKGIPEMYSKKYNITEIEDMKDFLRHLDNPTNMKGVIVHYGLRMLSKITLVNNGIFQIITPLKEGETENYLKSTSFERQSVFPYRSLVTEVTTLVPLYVPWEPLNNKLAQKESIENQILFDYTQLTKVYNEALYSVSLDNNKLYVAEGQITERHNTADIQLTRFRNQKEKEGLVDEGVELLRRIIEEATEVTQAFKTQRIILFDFQGKGLKSVELFAKSLFGAFEEQHDPASDNKLCICVFFPEKSLAYQFLRIFSIFYTKHLDENILLRDFQVFICGTPHSALDSSLSNIPEIHFAVSGRSSGDAARTAEVFCYHHASSTLDMIPFIEYLHDADTKNSKSRAHSLIPVNLFLNATIKHRDICSCFLQKATGSCWFISKMQKLVNNEVTAVEQGCKRQLTHVHIGSKIHITEFFDCAELFQNICTVKTFAYKVASSIATSSELGKSILIYGYELYSTFLIQEIVATLNEYLASIGKEPSVDYIIYTNENGGSILHYPLRKRGDRIPNLIPVIPVGTTLSTVYKMKNELYRHLTNEDMDIFPIMDIGKTDGASNDDVSRQIKEAQNRIDALGENHVAFKQLYVIVLVGVDSPFSSKTYNTLADNYWHTKENQSDVNSRTIFIQPEKNKTLTSADESTYPHGEDNILQAENYLSADTECFIPKSCPACNTLSHQPWDESVLISVDSVGTMPKTTFASISQTAQEDNQGMMSSIIDPEELLALFGSVDYGHVWDGNNHFQFYIDIPSYSKTLREGSHLKKKDKHLLDAWYTEINRIIPRGSYNILIAPLENETSGFASEVVEKCFDHGLRFIHIDIPNITIEDIRSRYSYVIQELNRVKDVQKVNFFYLQTCICSGKTLRKAMAIVRMLLFEASLPVPSTGSEFERIFTLIDRSSAYMVIDSYTHSEKKMGPTSYLRLNAPSLGTKSKSCSICEAVERCQRVAKRSADNELARYFYRQANRIGKKSTTETKESQAKEIMDSDKYVYWLIEWFRYIPESSERGKINPFVGVYSGTQECRNRINAIKKDKAEFEVQLKEYLQDHNEQDEELSLAKLECVSNYSFIKRVIKNDIEGGVIALRNFMRLYCEHECSEALGIDRSKMLSISNTVTSDSLIRITIDIFVGIIAEKTDTTKSDTNPFCTNSFLQKEWFISYAKVLSRGRIFQYHFVRQAILSILIYITHSLLAPYMEGRMDNDESVTSRYISDESLRSLDGIVESIEAIESVFQYQVLKVCFGRLADLQARYILSAEVIIAFINKTYELRERHEVLPVDKRVISNEMLFDNPFTPFPDKNKINNALLGHLKWCAMAGEDESRALLANDASRHLEKRIEGVKPVIKEAIRDISEKLSLEMTTVLYNGMERLWETWNTIPVRETLIVFKSSQGNKQENNNESLENNEKLHAIQKVFTHPSVAEAAKRHTLEEFTTYVDINQFWLYMQCAEEYLELLFRKCRTEKPANRSSKLNKDGRGQPLFRRMNPLHDFFVFLAKDYDLFNNGINESEAINRWERFSVELSCAFLLYKFVNDLNGEARVELEKNDIPYIYENICNCVREIFDASETYLAHSREGEDILLVKSSTGQGAFIDQAKYKISRKTKSSSKHERILALLGRKKEAQPQLEFDKKEANDSYSVLTQDKIVDIITAHRTDASNNDVSENHIVIKIELPGLSDKDPLESAYLIVQFRTNDSLPGEKTLARMKRSVLYMRDKLSRLLVRDLPVLMNYSSDYSSVKKLFNSASLSSLRALHLSDLHINHKDEQKQVESYMKILLSGLSGHEGKSPRKKCNELPKEVLLGGTYDLVIITGDIADGASNSEEQRKNYSKAGEFIRLLAFYLWSDESGRVKQDWVKRIVIIPGNHDYSSMSDFETVRLDKKRSSELAKPNRKGGETPARFFYYIDFLHKTFSLDLGEIWLNKLNSLRNYDRLGVSLLMVNTSGKVGPLRTNKVGIDCSTEELSALVKRIAKENTVLCLAHHGNDYSIQYVRDEFDDLSLYDNKGDSHCLEEAKRVILCNKSDNSVDIIKNYVKEEAFECIDKQGTKKTFELLSKCGIRKPTKKLSSDSLPVDKANIGCLIQGADNLSFISAKPDWNCCNDAWIQGALRKRIGNLRGGSLKYQNCVEFEWSLLNFDPGDACFKERVSKKLVKYAKQIREAENGTLIDEEDLGDLRKLIEHYDEMSKVDQADLNEKFSFIMQYSEAKVILCGHTHVGFKSNGGQNQTTFTIGSFSMPTCFVKNADPENPLQFINSALKQNPQITPTSIYDYQTIRYSDVMVKRNKPFEYKHKGLILEKSTCDSEVTKIHKYEIEIIPEGDTGHDNTFRTEKWNYLESV